jgi:hypothetical protein
MSASWNHIDILVAHAGCHPSYVQVVRAADASGRLRKETLADRLFEKIDIYKV